MAEDDVSAFFNAEPGDDGGLFAAAAGGEAAAWEQARREHGREGKRGRARSDWSRKKSAS